MYIDKNMDIENMSKTKKVSIIVPVKAINDYIREAVPYHMQLDYSDFELLIFPDAVSDEELKNPIFADNRIKIIPSGETGPAEKRDMSMQYATGEIFAFIDDDAYPRQDWLKNAAKLLEDETVGAVGGPAVTAPSDPLLMQASGKTLESFVCSGKYTYRYIPGEAREDDDIPSVNLIVKRDVFEQVGGYDSNFYPGEDTKLCMDIVNHGKKLLYDPNILVYHHRRKMFKGHLKQITNYAKHRGYFAKKLPQTSFRLSYFIPTMFDLGLIGGLIVCPLIPILWYVYIGVISIYLILCAFSLMSCSSFKLFAISLLGIVATHVSYGVFFIKGLLSKELER